MLSRDLPASAPKVSVLIPTFNRPEWLRQSLESVLSQDGLLEVLIHDNGSEHDTAEVLNSFQDCRIKRFRSEVNNPCAAYSLMYDHVNGDYVVLFTDDDVMLPGCLAKKVEFLDRYESGMVFTPVRTMDALGNDLGPSPIGRLMQPLTMEFALIACPVPMPAAMFRREYLGLGAGFGPLSDWGLWLEIMHRAGAGYIPEDTIYLRTHMESETQKTGIRSGKFLEFYPKVWKHWLDRGIKPTPDGWLEMMALYTHLATEAGQPLEDALTYFCNEVYNAA